MANPSKKAQQQLKKVRRRAAKLERAAIIVYRKEGKKIHQELAGFFNAGKFYPVEKNKLKSLGAISRKWKKRKARLGLQLRRGHAGGTIQRSASSSKSFANVEKGWSIDWTRPNLKGRKRVGRSKKGKKIVYPAQPMKKYFRHYNSQKAQSSLGTPAPKQIARANKAAFNQVKKGVNLLLPSAMKVKGGIAEMKIVLGRFGKF